MRRDRSRAIAAAFRAPRAAQSSADVVDRRLGVGEQVPQAGVLAALQRLDQHPPVAPGRTRTCARPDRRPADRARRRRTPANCRTARRANGRGSAPPPSWRSASRRRRLRRTGPVRRRRNGRPRRRRHSRPAAPRRAVGAPPPPTSRGGSTPRYSATMAISSARSRRWPLSRSVTAEGERPSALARPLRVLPVLRARRGSNRRSMSYPLFGFSEQMRNHEYQKKFDIDDRVFHNIEQNKNTLGRRPLFQRRGLVS